MYHYFEIMRGYESDETRFYLIYNNSKEFILEGADILIRNRVIYADNLIELMREKYDYIENLKLLYKSS